MDGVVADFDKAIRTKNNTINSKDLSHQDMVEKIVSEDENFFIDLDLIPGTIDAVNELKKDFEIYFLSTPMHEYPYSYSGKRIWLKKHFGEWVKKRLILTHRKDLNIGDFLVDDRLKNGSESFTGEHIHFGQPEFPNWETVVEYLKNKK